MLKNWACMGMGTGPEGSILVTDNDIIEISNLNRQFLYRAWNVQHSKSETSAKAAVAMNPAMKIKAYTTKVCTETEDVFNDAFWSGLDGVCNALDNIHARLYVDSKCVFFGKSLLESGTLGTKGNTQVMVPHLSQTYGETSDPEPKVGQSVLFFLNKSFKTAFFCCCCSLGNCEMFASFFSVQH